VRFVVIGSGKTAVEILRTLSALKHIEFVAALGDIRRESVHSSLQRVADRLKSPFHPATSLRDADALAFLRRAAPDYVISANNFLIFGQKALEIPRFGTINFHNGPLPRYAGLNPCSWALFRNEKTYGITWHVVEEEIDAGGILHRTFFDVEPTETAASLIIKCITEGIQSFRTAVLPRLLEGNLNVNPQESAEREYFSARQIPFKGLLPWWLPPQELDRFARALSFAPLPNMFYRPRIVLPSGSSVFCEEVQYRSGGASSRPGRVTSVDDEALHIAALRGELVVRGFFAGTGEEVSAEAMRKCLGQILGGNAR